MLRKFIGIVILLLFVALTVVLPPATLAWKISLGVLLFMLVLHIIRQFITITLVLALVALTAGGALFLKYSHQNKTVSAGQVK